MSFSYLGKCLEYGSFTKGNELLERRSTLLALGACVNLEFLGTFLNAMFKIREFLHFSKNKCDRRAHPHRPKNNTKVDANKELTQLLHQQMQAAQHTSDGAPDNGGLLALQSTQDLHHSLQRCQTSLGQSIGI